MRAMASIAPVATPPIAARSTTPRLMRQTGAPKASAASRMLCGTRRIISSVVRATIGIIRMARDAPPASAAALVSHVITRLKSWRRARLCMCRLPLAARHGIDQQPRRRVNHEGDDEEDQPQLDQRVTIDFRSRFGEFVGDGRSDGERW